MVSDAALLDRYAQAQDAEALAELFERYSRLVYGTCLRVTQNRDDAEDVAQECFLELARRAGSITSSLPGWLHSLARSRSIDAIRQASRRRRYEEQAAAERRDNSEPAWSDIAPYVDQALEELPEHLRAPIILHYLEGRSQGQMAAELGIDQSTVSRLLKKALTELRERLKAAGVVPSLAVLAGLLAGNAATAAPETLAASVGKMAIAGVGKAGGAAATAASAGGTGSSSVLPSAALGTLPARVVLVVAATAVVFGGVIAIRQVANPTRRLAQTSAGEETGMGALRIGESDSVVLNGCSYRIEWLSPKRLRDFGEPRPAGKADYDVHIGPVYNIHEDILSEDVWPERPVPEGCVPGVPGPNDWRWGVMWEEMAKGLADKVEWFALLAYADDKLAGMIRFFPKTLTVARYGAWPEQEHRREWSDDILWIGAAYVDRLGVTDGLDTELARRVVEYARAKGFAKVQALGWSEVRTYAMWGQSFPASVYEGLGFRAIATTDGCADALGDMLGGSHGEATKQQVEAELAAAIPRETAHQCHIMELGLR